MKFLLAKIFRKEAVLESYSMPRAELLGRLAGKRVAIVGNARSLSATEQGHAIDRADIVIRINAAPIPKPLSHGKRTDWLAMSVPVPVPILHARDPEVILWMTAKRKRLQERTARRAGFFLNRREDWDALRAKLPANPTTGLMVIDLVAQSQAASIDLYGFDFFASQSLSGGRTASDVPHDFASERAFVEVLMARDRRVTLHAME